MKKKPPAQTDSVLNISACAKRWVELNMLSHSFPFLLVCRFTRNGEKQNLKQNNSFSIYTHIHTRRHTHADTLSQMGTIFNTSTTVGPSSPSGVEYLWTRFALFTSHSWTFIFSHFGGMKGGHQEASLIFLCSKFSSTSGTYGVREGISLFVVAFQLWMNRKDYNVETLGDDKMY